jgi:hypothetical protein
MHNLLSDMDLQIRPQKPISHFLAMTSSPAGRCLCGLAGAERAFPRSAEKRQYATGVSRRFRSALHPEHPSKLADHLTMVREVSAISPFPSAKFVEQPTSRTIGLPLSRASDDRSKAIRHNLFFPLILRQNVATGRNGRKRRSKMVREPSPCAIDAYAITCRLSGNAISPSPRKRSDVVRRPLTVRIPRGLTCTARFSG